MQETKEFKTESKRLLDLMINSIYTNKEIFLRELISNASDAIDKYHYLSLSDDKLKKEDHYHVFLSYDKNLRTITIEDNGIGIFKKIENDLSLQDEHQSLLELAKGKFTSNPKEHSGEGIFFSCRACDLFLIHSDSLTYSLDRASDNGKFIETDKDLEDNNFSGTLVLMAMNNNSSNSLKKFLMNIFQVTKIKLLVKLFSC